jgi:beta-mannosidase
MKYFSSISFLPCLCASVAIQLLTALPVLAQEPTQSLNSNWQFTESGKNEWLPATVPGTVHTDLLANGKISDPYIGTNESKVQWVETKAWEYKTTFNASDAIWKSKHKELVFEGLDTYAFVYLNDSLILTGENMFLEYRIDISKSLKKSNNIIRIVFHPASELIEKNKALSDIKNLPGGDRVFIRKAQYQFGWDWGPRLVTSGIWKNVRMEGWNDFKIQNFTIKTAKIENDTAYLNIQYSFLSSLENNQEVRVSISESNKIITEEKFGSNILFPGVITLFPTHLVKIPHPRLWWCNGMGTQEMYHFVMTVTIGKNKIVKQTNQAIRTIQLETTKDANGESFTFYLNNEPVFIKGANWIPADNFVTRVSSEKYYSLIKSVQQSNMNMLRVWGGGIYENEDFYNDCDSLGIMVWQDFMYAGGIYPADRKFRASFEMEAYVQYERLSKHPCIAAWCGNNEIKEGWNNWGWQKEMKISQADSARMWNNEQFIFLGVLDSTLKSYDPYSIYIPTSPSTGWGHPEAYKSGDVHYWGVWWGMEPFSSYDDHVGRFVSEYGFQATPPLSSFALFDTDGKFSLNDSTTRAHQKHPKGFETISEYISRDYPVPAEFSDYVYVSQIVQRDGVSRAISDHRKAMPYCMGTLFWQYNDCWPVTSWSAVDYYGQKKLLQYALKDLYAPLLISVTERNDSILLYVINDDTISHKGLLAFQCMNLNGTVTRTSFTPTTVYTGRSSMVLGFERKQFFDTLKPQDAVLHMVFNYENNKSITANYYFANTKSLNLSKDPGLVNDIVPVVDKPGSYTVTLRTVSLAKNVYLSFNDAKATFSDNGFDMMPGETKEVTITTSLSLEQLKAALKIQMMNSFRG